MALSHRDIFAHPLFSFSDLNRFFDDFSDVSPQSQGGQNGQVQQASRSFRPKTDVHVEEAQNVVTATFELPGLEKDNINIELREAEGLLSISGQTLQSDERKDDKGYVVRERREGRFARAIPVSRGTKPTDIQAKMENGVLTVTFPHKSAEQETKRITIA